MDPYFGKSTAAYRGVLQKGQGTAPGPRRWPRPSQVRRLPERGCRLAGETSVPMGLLPQGFHRPRGATSTPWSRTRARLGQTPELLQAQGRGRRRRPRCRAAAPGRARSAARRRGGSVGPGLPPPGSSCHDPQAVIIPWAVGSRPSVERPGAAQAGRRPAGASSRCWACANACCAIRVSTSACCQRSHSSRRPPWPSGTRRA